MKKISIAMTLMGVVSMMGCVEELDMTEYGEAAEAISIADGAFVSHYVSDSKSCRSNEVMVGIHFSQGKATCARLNYNYRVASSYIDEPGWGSTQVSSSPNMHGCAPNYFIQAIEGWEDLRCVSLEDSLGRALEVDHEYHDGRGPGDNGTQSDSTYGLTPRMHVCRNGYAMRGVHRSQNDLYCGN